MLPKFRSWPRSGLLALGVIGRLSVPATGAPAGMAMAPSAGPDANPIFIRHVYAGHSYYRGNWNNGWRYRNWNNGWRYRNHGWYGGNYYRPYYRNYGPSIGLSFG